MSSTVSELVVQSACLWIWLRAPIDLSWQNAHDSNALVFFGAVLRLFGLFGYRMELHNCHNCQKPIQPTGTKFHFQLWSVECADCQSPEETVKISADVIKVLRFLVENDFEKVSHLRVPEKE
jgi:recombinational DNA repair protein (RecF pathway)